MRDAITTTWTPWLTDTTSTEAQFTGAPGHSYYFQVRATDQVNNTGAWQQAGPVVIRSVTKYYTFGNSRVAMRQGDEVYYLHGDHLGSTSLTTDGSGAVVAQSRYLPYGQERWSDGAAPTDFGFTGQRHDSYMELIDYGARWYDPQIGRWLSPDTIIPDPANPQSLNRYSYVYGNPIRYNDPSGHCGPLTPLCIVVALGAVALMASTDMPINDDIVEAEAAAGKTDYRDTYPSDTQGITGLAGLAAPVAISEASSAAAGCIATNCAQKAPQWIQKSVEWLAGDGDLTNEAQSASQTALSVTDKLQRYVLNPEHPIGGSKAKWFEQALGYTRENMNDLAKQVVFDPSKAIPTQLTEFGQKYQQVISITGANGKVIDVPFIWIRNTDEIVRLVTAIPPKP